MIPAIWPLERPRAIASGLGLARRRLLGQFAALGAAWTAGAGPGQAADRSKDQGASDEPYLEIPTLTATVMRPDGSRGVLTVQASLFIPDPKLRARAALSIPLLLNAYVPGLQGYAYRMGAGTTPNVDFLALTLQRASDQVLGRGSKVLLGGVMIN